MISIHKAIRARLKVPTNDNPSAGMSIADLAAVQWSSEFERLMRNRLIMGAMRYGPLTRQQNGEFANVESAIARLRRYQQTGNTEHLVDAANLCLVEFTKGNHPKRHFAASDDGEHTKIIQ